jgi:hypothetical protein
VVSKEVQEMSDKKLNGQVIDQLQKVNLKAGGMFVNPREATTASTPVAVISGAPQVFGNDLDKIDSQNELIQAIKNILVEKLLPDPPLSSEFLRGSRNRRSWQWSR